MDTNVTSTAVGIMSLLLEPENEIKIYALNKLNSIVDVFWAEISDSVDTIEHLYEDKAFEHRCMAALVLSKVYYHLGAFDESRNYALGANELFDVNDTSEYVQTIIAKCIDKYTDLRVQQAEQEQSSAHGDNKIKIDPRLESVVDRMFQRCFHDKQYKHALGIALETRRVDIFEKTILDSKNTSSILAHAQIVCMTLIQCRHFRNQVLRILVKLYLGLTKPDYISVCQCLIYLDDPRTAAEILEKLLKTTHDESILMAYQVGFDLYESATQNYLQRVQNFLRHAAPVPIAQSVGPKFTPEVTGSMVITSCPSANHGETKMDVDAEEVKDSDTPKIDLKEEMQKKIDALNKEDRKLQTNVTKLDTILSGDTTISIHLQFLIRTNKTDMQVLKKTKDVIRNSVCHNATIIANAYLHAGTTSDRFLRENLEWLSRATNWAKFTATASLGVIHRGHETQALNLMSTYLPKDSTSSSSYSEGGGLYALGLIHANHGGDMIEYLLNQLKDANSDVVRHGGCLGVGLAAMGTANQTVYEQLKYNLFQDEAITGEAAGIAMGLVMLGTKNQKAIEDMLTYAQETQHEKIVRGLAVGIALTMYGLEQEADELVDQLMTDKDPILRWSAIYTFAMAYCGTASNKAIRRLLHVAVSDVSDDVRRAAVTSIGFILFRAPEQCPAVVSLLSESYNPHVRYGAAMALGIACAGTGLREALALLEPMMNDPVSYVRQGALIASALVAVQQNEITCAKSVALRATYTRVIADKHEDITAKFGAILAQGIIDAGGRNSSISLQTRSGHASAPCIVGMLVFCQFWYWYPLSHFLSLSFQPTCLIALNQDLQMPKINFKSSAKNNNYAYPAIVEEKKVKPKEKVETAILSTTGKQQQRNKKKESEAAAAATDTKPTAEPMDVDEVKPVNVKMDVDDTEPVSKTKDNKDTKKKEDIKAKKEDTKAKKEDSKSKKDETKAKNDDEKKEEVEKEKPKEADYTILSNPARVMKQQLSVVSMHGDEDLEISKQERYDSLKEISTSGGGVIMVRDLKPGTEQNIVEIIAAGGPDTSGSDDTADEPAPPEPFNYLEE